MDKILLIEDNEDDVALTLRAFRKNNIANDVMVARDGREALDRFAPGGPFGPESNELPSLVLLDLKLPRVSGMEVLRELRDDPRTSLLPVVILTSSDEDRDRVEGYALGANSFVRKPVDFSDFAEAIRLLGLYWLVLNRPATPPRVPGE